MENNFTIPITAPAFAHAYFTLVVDEAFGLEHAIPLLSYKEFYEELKKKSPFVV